MNALNQYIELYEHNRDTIGSHSPDELNRRRPGALATLKTAGRLPERGDEGFPVVSLNEMFGPDFGLNIRRLDFAGGYNSNSGCASVANNPAAIVINDSVLLNPGRTQPEGVEILTFREAAAKYPGFMADEIAPSDNPVVALNDLLVQDGIYIRIAAGTSVEKPIQILNEFNGSIPMMGIRRVRIAVERGARASVLLCDHPHDRAAAHLGCRVVEVSVAQDASFHLYDLEEASNATGRASVFASRQESGSSLNVCTLFLRGGVTRNEYYPSHAGENCTTRLGGIVIGGGEQKIDNAVFLTHTFPRCRAEQLFKYALFDNSRGAFEGLVKVNPGSVFTQTHQTNRNLLAGEGARMYAMPQLEIYCDEVKASHGSATGRLDERALFYMRSRGIPEAEARMMLVNAFMTDVLEFVDDEPLRERLRHLIDRRLRGVETVCSGCRPSDENP